jgi:hypothetical protein
VRTRDLFQLTLGLREGDVHAGLTAFYSLEKELQRERRLSGTRIAFYEVKVTLGETSLKEVIETGNSRMEPSLGIV